MKLKPYEQKLLKFLKLYPVADIEALSRILAVHMQLNYNAYEHRKKIGYIIRSLSCRGLIRSRNDGYYSLLKLGNEFTKDIKPFYTSSGISTTRERLAKIAGVAALLAYYGVRYDLTEPKVNTFVPSTVWRSINTGVISTSRFTGVLTIDAGKFSVYDIGDGDVDWQTSAESSLFGDRWFEGENALHGMILLTDKNYIEVSNRIIQNTRNIGHKSYENEYRTPYQTRKKYTKSPIRLRKDYRQVMVVDKANIKFLIDLLNVWKNNHIILQINGLDKYTLTDDISFDFIENWEICFFNPHNDVLKTVFFLDFLETVRENSAKTNHNLYGIESTENILIYLKYGDVEIFKGIKTPEFQYQEYKEDFFTQIGIGDYE